MERMPHVTNRLAFVLALLIVTALAADVMLDDSKAVMFLLRKFVDMVEWLAFWR
jgi:hypothetical protein